MKVYVCYQCYYDYCDVYDDLIKICSKREDAEAWVLEFEPTDTEWRNLVEYNVE